ncbi:MAG: Adenine DNA glycosylase [Candidatus Ordinivivax streblomastigis]|uniref:Adenine DNA glycosylase n=1 Tax=Candidatus Ordinivivax streblomastigis TaxID=2540710 RepID=A0A5M8P2V8_9BACT|nr:MAG: Adenine DNA glycosylase [Candidatus Ordinivivax streblomastigis]
MDKFNSIGEKLMDWYSQNQRILPWRNTNDPYKIWISEIILQQTRVIQGLEYYNRFIQRFPTVIALAEANEQEVLKYWQGLGYYSRARNLHFSAQMIVNEYNSNFPKDYQAILHLKGIGEYTAAAIVSFAWNMPYPVVDGNVFRFLSRLFAIDEPVDTGKGKKYFTELCAELMDQSRAGTFNQAIMEFGALQCVPASPDCSVCPFQAECLAYAKKTVALYPVKQNKTRTKDLYLYYFHICDSDSLYIRQRTEKGIWQNLYEFPLIESEIPLSFNQLVKMPSFQKWFPQGRYYDFQLVIEHRKHVLSHRILHTTFYKVALGECPKSLDAFTKIPMSDMEQYPVHRLMQILLQSLGQDSD